MTRAVIDLPRDITPLMPRLCHEIKTCVHSQVTNTLSFNYGGLGVIVEAEKLSVLNTTDEKAAQDIADWFNGMIKAAE